MDALLSLSFRSQLTDCPMNSAVRTRINQHVVDPCDASHITLCSHEAHSACAVALLVLIIMYFWMPYKYANT